MSSEPKTKEQILRYIWSIAELSPTNQDYLHDTMGVTTIVKLLSMTDDMIMDTTEGVSPHLTKAEASSFIYLRDMVADIVHNSEYPSDWTEVVTEPSFLKYMSTRGEGIKGIPSDSSHSDAKPMFNNRRPRLADYPE